MFTSVSTRSRSANAYLNVGIETSVGGASPHQLVSLLFEALQQSLVGAKGAMLNGNIPVKGRAIGRAVRLLEEGLKAGLDAERGGELAANLRVVYDICILKLTEANLRNNPALIDEAIALINPIADGWSQIRSQASGNYYQS